MGITWLSDRRIVHVPACLLGAVWTLPGSSLLVPALHESALLTQPKANHFIRSKLLRNVVSVSVYCRIRNTRCRPVVRIWHAIRRNEFENRLNSIPNTSRRTAGSSAISPNHDFRSTPVRPSPGYEI